MQHWATKIFCPQALFISHRTSLLQNQFWEGSSPIHQLLNHNLALFSLLHLSTPRITQKMGYFQPLSKELTHWKIRQIDIWLQEERERCREYQHCARKGTRKMRHHQPNRPVSHFCSTCSEAESEENSQLNQSNLSSLYPAGQLEWYRSTAGLLPIAMPGKWIPLGQFNWKQHWKPLDSGSVTGCAWTHMCTHMDVPCQKRHWLMRSIQSNNQSI